MFRYSDADGLTSESTDFVRRKRHGRLWVFCLFYSLLLGLVITYLLGQGYAERDITLVMLIIGCLIAVIAHALFSIQRNLDLIMAVEFQNALFSSAINTRAEFTLIMRRDGSAIYADYGFRERFPEIRNVDDRVLDHLVKRSKMDELMREQLFDALQNKRTAQFVVDLTMMGEEGALFMLSITPLRRPQGFFMMQGRHYVEKRSADVLSPSAAP